MLDLISLGTVSIDLYYKGSSLTEGDGRFELAIGGKYFVDHFYEGLGGGGANVAIGVTKAGLSVGLMAKIGNNPFKSLICKTLDDEKVRHQEFCNFTDDYINISSILLNARGEKTIINYRTDHQHIMTCEEDYNKLDKAKAIYMANLSKVTLAERIRVLQYAKKNNKKVFANLNVTDCRRPIEEVMHFASHVDGLIINAYEYADIIKAPYESIDFDGNVVEKYAPFHSNSLLVITDGKKGSYAYFQGKHYHVPAVSVEKVIDTTGAGDAYTAAFIASYLAHEDVQKAMQAGSSYAVKILGKLGAN